MLTKPAKNSVLGIVKLVAHMINVFEASGGVYEFSYTQFANNYFTNGCKLFAGQISGLFASTCEAPLSVGKHTGYFLAVRVFESR